MIINIENTENATGSIFVYFLCPLAELVSHTWLVCNSSSRFGSGTQYWSFGGGKPDCPLFGKKILVKKPGIMGCYLTYSGDI